MSREAVTTEESWRSVADDLAGALQTTVLRNPSLSAYDWARARAALDRYQQAGGAPPSTDDPVDPEGQ